MDYYTRFIKPVQGAQFPSEYDADSSMLADLIGRDVSAIAVRTLNLAVAGSIAIELPCRGFVPYFWVTDSLNKTRQPDGLVSVYIGTTQPNATIDQPFPAKHNRGFRGTFTKCYITWLAQTNTSVDLVFHKSCRTPWMTDDLAVSGGGGGNATLAGDNTFTGLNTFDQTATFENGVGFNSGAAIQDDGSGGLIFSGAEFSFDNAVTIGPLNIDGGGNISTGGGVTAGSISGDGSNLTGYAPGFNVANADNAFNISLSGGSGSFLFNNGGNIGFDFGYTDGAGHWNGMSSISFFSGGSISTDGAGGLNFIGTTNSMDSAGNCNFNSMNTGAYKLEGNALVESLSSDVFTFLPDASNTFTMNGNTGAFTCASLVPANGVSGSFTAGINTVTVTNGIITSIV